MRIPVLEVPLRVEFRRVARAASGHPGKVHVVVNGVPMCDVAETTQWQQSLGTPNATERVEASVFAGSSACVKCYASVSDVTPEQAKQSLLDQDQQLRTSPGEEGPTYALWVVPGEIWWDTGQTRSIHYILRGPDGWERHKIATDVEGRKHHDPRLFAALAAHLPEP